MITKELIGKTVYLLPTGNNVRRNGVNNIIEAKVRKVAKVFITMVGQHSSWASEYKLRFNKENNSLDSDYNSGYILFESMQEVDDFKLKGILTDNIGKHIREYSWGQNVTLEQLKAIAEILNVEV